MAKQVIEIPKEEETKSAEEMLNAAGIPSEGDEETLVQTDGKEKEIPSSSPEEKKPEQAAPPSEGANSPDDSNTPFHKHPRWKEMHERNKRLEHELNEFKSFKDQTSQELEKVRERSRGTEEVQLPTWFSKLYGDTPEAKDAYREYARNEQQQESERIRRVKEELSREYQAQADAQKKQQEHWNNWMEESFTQMADEGKKFDKNELIKFALKYRPTNNDGIIDLRLAHELMEERKAMETSKKTEVKKAVAASASPSSSGESSSKDYMTSQELRYKDFRDLI